MSVSPLQNFWKPPPVPETPTVTRTSGATERNSSATASVTGKTVLEPSIATLPDSFSPPAAVVDGPSSSSPQEAAISAKTATAAASHLNEYRLMFPPVWNRLRPGDCATGACIQRRP